MNKVYIKTKILVNGLFPLENFKIDEFTFKDGIYNEKAFDTEDDDYIFYSTSYLLLSCYSTSDKKGIYYGYFENDNYIELDVSDETYNDRQKLNKYTLDYMIKKVQFLEKKLRLITNLSIGLPVFKSTVDDKDGKNITYVGYVTHHFSLLNISKYDEDMKILLNKRLRLWISNDTITELENKNCRYKRALKFYNDSFFTNDIEVRFTLLFSSLESLFNLTGEEVIENVSKYSSKILFENTKKEKKYYHKIKDFYDARSLYIHGNEPRSVSEKMEFDLREIVREVLLMYWYISHFKEINNPEDIIKFIDNNNQNTIELILQVFKKSLHMTNYQEFYNETRERLLNGETNLLIEK
jgi:hypothetical protein